MTRRNTSDSAPREFQMSFKFGDIVYVPHFRNNSVFVGPGYPRATRQRFSEEELVRLGATKVPTLLWTRANHGIVNDITP